MYRQDRDLNATAPLLFTAHTVVEGSVTGSTATRSCGGVSNRKAVVYAQSGGSVTGNNPDNVFSEP